MKVEVSSDFMDMLVVRYSALLKRAEVRKAQRQYNKRYNTRKLRKELRKLYNEILTAEPGEIPRLRKRFIEVRKEINRVLEAKNADPTVQRYREESKALRNSIARLDQAIIRQLADYGYDVHPMGVDEVESEVKRLIPEPRQVPDESGVVEAKP